MINLTRRQLICGASLLALAGGSLAASQKRDIRNAINGPTRNELLQILSLWQSRETQSPKSYLASRGVDIHSKAEIAQLSQEDFVNNELFEVKGLVLAKTEAATIALFAEAVL